MEAKVRVETGRAAVGGRVEAGWKRGGNSAAVGACVRQGEGAGTFRHAVAGLAERLRARIEAEGPLRFSAWMEACLYDRDDGYYMRPGRKTGPGPDADFATSPTLHPFLGRAVADEAVEAWQDAGADGPLEIIEHGGGEGDLARAALARLDAVAPDIDVRWTHVERSIEHRRRQQDADDRLAWADAAPDVPWAFTVAHEFLDALPFDLLERRKGNWAEVRVDLDGTRFVETLGVPAPHLLAAAPPAGPHPDNQRFPVMDAARDWFRHLPPGTTLVVDYGGPEAWLRDPAATVRTFRHHSDAGPPVEAPGEKDITASLDTDQMQVWAEAAGWQGVSLQSQEEWLIGHGILEALNATDRSTQAGASEYLRLRQLLLPTGLGQAFFVARFRRARATAS